MQHQIYNEIISTYYARAYRISERGKSYATDIRYNHMNATKLYHTSAKRENNQVQKTSSKLQETLHATLPNNN